MSEKAGGWQGSPESIEYRPGKGAFLALLGVSSLGVVAAAFLFWLIPSVGLKNIHPSLPYVMGALMLAVCLFVLAGASVVTLSLLKGRVVFYTPWFRGLLVKFFLPLMVASGKLLGIDRIKIERAFLDINNQMVKLMGRRCRPGKLLILMPHCIQYDNCRIKVTRDVRNCAGCGKCEIGNLLDLSSEFGVSLFISTGGSVARRKLYEERPDAVVAVACERDLTSGVQDAYPLPVVAIVNKRPNGYCMETGVAIEDVKAAIIDLMGADAQGGAAQTV